MAVIWNSDASPAWFSGLALAFRCVWASGGLLSVTIWSEPAEHNLMDGEGSMLSRQCSWSNEVEFETHECISEMIMHGSN